MPEGACGAFESAPVLASVLPARRRLRTALAALAVAAAMVAPPFAGIAAAADPPGVILVSWDGVRLDTLRSLLHWQPIAETPEICPGNELTPPRLPSACGDYWTCLPTLCGFELVESRVTSGKTLTRVQHASMLTGETPDRTTIHSNNGSSSVPFGLTIYERLQTYVGPNITFAHVGSHRYTVRGILGWVQGSIIPADNVRTRGRPDKFTGMGSNENLLPLLATFEGKPFFAFQHQKGADMAGHGVGDRSEQYRIAIIAADDRLKELLDELDRLGMAERTHVFISTDHGFMGNTHLGGLRPMVGHTWIASQKDKLQCYTVANVIDIVPTVMAVFGIDASTTNPPAPGRSLLDPDRVGECVPPTCGDGVVEVGEDCEPFVPVTDTCEAIGFLEGNLGCTAQCRWDTSDCPDVLAKTKLSLSPSTSDSGLDLQIKTADRDRGGPDFNPAADAISVEIWNGPGILWEGGTDNFDTRWRDSGDSRSWTAARGSREDRLTGVKMSGPLRRMKMQVSASGIEDMGDFLAADSLSVVIRAGAERFDTTMACHVSRDELGLRCEFEKPDVD